MKSSIASRSLFAFIVALALAAASTAHAQIIAINFASGAYGAYFPISAQTGVIPVAAADWNNINDGNSASDVTGLIDSSGNALTNVTLSFSSNDSYASGNSNLGGLLNAYLDSGNITVSLTNIPYAEYNVYAYVASDTNGRVVPGGTIGSETLSFTTDAAGVSSFVVNSDPNAGNPPANVLLFTDVTGSTLNYTQAGGGGNSGNGIAGLEIVEISEPNALGMAGVSFGLFAVAAMMRRRHLLV